MSTLTPRTCHAIFTGGRFPGMTPRLGRKKASGSGDRFEQTSSGVSVMDSVDESEDHMDAVMREMYGSRWNLGTSASELAHAGGADPRAYMGMTRTGVGLGLGEDALETSRADRRAPVPPAEHSTLTPESTLRLVPPSLHGPDSYC
ncbi:hypothetical protein WOLCODRAFT_134886 [Wolfiporia cocos MD-104 SS10]|uniref:Uncharacterized protein n=1 Tax=Wolfiporia cocos (strain MD-104) TaxID=742152 RepID=A0A2H3J2W1_WOLCO|nr:hypothetical protein WOLCODRAFT_134886 [Wolfiporia cocos MD-104 SS10]